jgi:hypothetical protein
MQLFMKKEIKTIQKALQETKIEQHKTTELLQLLQEFLNEPHTVGILLE